MKKINSILVLLSLVGIITTSCMKDNDVAISSEQHLNTTTPTGQLLKRKQSQPETAAVNGVAGFEGIYQLASNMGHKSTDCGGKCKYMNGVYFHADCQGFGNVCTLRASVSVSYTGTGNNYIGKGLNDYEPTDEADFLMPARSFKIVDENLELGYIWLNIPEQILLRDPATHQFIYKDISFTEDQKYTNR